MAAIEAAGGTAVDVDLPYLDAVNYDAYPALQSEFKRDVEKPTCGPRPDGTRAPWPG